MNATLVASGAQLASAVGDPGRTRLVLGAIVALIAIGVVLAGAAVWLFRTTRHDHPVLAPLELMGDRSWRRADHSTRKALLDEHRPPGAAPLPAADAEEADAELADAEAADAELADAELADAESVSGLPVPTAVTSESDPTIDIDASDVRAEAADQVDDERSVVLDDEPAADDARRTDTADSESR